MGKHKNWKVKKAKKKPFDALYLPVSVYAEMCSLTAQAVGEISGFGRTTITEPLPGYFLRSRSIRLEEQKIFKQECNAGHTELDAEELTRMYVSVAQDDGNPEDWNLWWHSHVRMGTGFSTIDDRTMEELTKDGGFIVGLCINKYMEHTATVYRDGKCIQVHLPVLIVPDLDIEFARGEIDEKVKELAYYKPHKKYGAIYGDLEEDGADAYPPKGLSEFDETLFI